MKSLAELRQTPNLIIVSVGMDGGTGEIHFHNWKGSVVWSFGGGWDHISVSPFKKHITPSWDDMCRVKNMFFNDDEVVMQYHPAKSEYVNLMSNCLHLWRPQEKELPIPPILLV